MKFRTKFVLVSIAGIAVTATILVAMMTFRNGSLRAEITTELSA